MFHPLLITSNTELPHQFTNPFYYEPHPLCTKAAVEVQNYLCTKHEWKNELEEGKMFGIMIVENENHEIGFLAAYSGILMGKNDHDYFVPPVFDLLTKDGFFKKEEKVISELNRSIDNLENDSTYKHLKEKIEFINQEFETKHRIFKEECKEAKRKRDEIRRSTDDATVLNQLIAESQFQKAEWKRKEKKIKLCLTDLQHELEGWQNEIATLKKERKLRSANLQTKLFDSFIVHNALKEVKSLSEIFDNTPQKTPPSGSGECAAPKLLEHAYRMNFKPIAMAEFWVGKSPKQEIKHHGHYYTACKGKCYPILSFMMQGLEVEENKLHSKHNDQPKYEYLYDDEWIVVINKPEGVLSAPGKGDNLHIGHYIKEDLKLDDEPIVVHRLDMATSGILLFAKDRNTHKLLQQQFEKRSIKKSYIALIDGIISKERGIIKLPLSANYNDRPRQIVDYNKGKEAITHYSVLKQVNGKTRILFEPITGRTHQLRVHAAHHDGLNTAILGDELYGTKEKRLYLHAQKLIFEHPITGGVITLECQPNF